VVGLSEGFQAILDRYGETPPGSPWGIGHPVRDLFAELRNALMQATPVRTRPSLKIDFAGIGRQAAVPWLAIMDRRETTSTQSGVYCVYLFRQDLSGMYLTFAVGVNEPRRQMAGKYREWLKSRVVELRPYGEGLPKHRFSLDGNIDLRTSGTLGVDYQLATVAHRFYVAGAIPEDSLLLDDLEAVLSSYDQYLSREAPHPTVPPERNDPIIDEHFDAGAAVAQLTQQIEEAGFVFEPWQIAAYIAALKTKPFVILAGVTGTGKSTLPALVAQATGGKSELIPVRPDWTDSSEVIGYTDLSNKFRPGALLRVARQAMESANSYWTCVLDELNLARVEQYLAEVLSRIEQRTLNEGGGYASPRLIGAIESDQAWATVTLPSNLALVGTVNMDESAHGFSRKVLDRAFTLELSEIDLTRWEGEPSQQVNVAPVKWPVHAWYPRANRLAALANPTEGERAIIERAIGALSQANEYLVQAQLQVGYRTRDEVALFVLHSEGFRESFRDRKGESVDPLDLALHMKLLPRIIGGSAPVRRAILQLLGWSVDGVPRETEDDAQRVVDKWHEEKRPNALSAARYPRSAARLCLMWDRVVAEGFTSFWL